MPRTTCPNCQREDQVSALMAKMPILCKTCGTRVVVQADAGANVPKLTPSIGVQADQGSNLQKKTPSIGTVSQQPLVEEFELIAIPDEEPVKPTRPRGLADMVLPPPSRVVTAPKTQAEPKSEHDVNPMLLKGMATRTARLIARIVDGFVIGLFLLCGYFLSDVVLRVLEWDEQFAELVLMMFFLAAEICRWVLITYRGKDFGKLFMKLTITRTDGSKAGFKHGVFLREMIPDLLTMFTRTIYFLTLLFLPDFALIALVLVYAAPFLALANLLFIFRAETRCLHDYLADTVVVKD